MVEQPELYPHQQDMVNRLRRSISQHRASILQAPPGTGKTRIAKWMLGAAANREPKENQTGKSLFAVHRRGLVDNASNSFSEYPELPHGILMSGVEHNASRAVQVASIDTLLSWFCEGGEYNWDETFDLIVFDEAHSHHSKLQTFLTAHNKRRTDRGLGQPYVIGLTATPQAKGLADIYQEIIRGPETQWLIDQGFLSPYRYFRATQGKLGLLVKRGDEYTKDSVCSAMEGLSGDLVRDWKKFAEGRATVGFFPRRTHAKEAQEALCAAGINAEYVDGETDDDRRQMLYKWLNDGTIEYLCNVGVVERGTDIPRVGCVQMCTAVGNVVRWLQMIGRGSRVHPDVPDCCLARDSLVLTNRGEIPIQDVRRDDLVWDGVEYCRHDGPVCNGTKAVVEWGGLLLTPDHKVLTNDGWKEAKEAISGCWRSVSGGVGGMPVWTSDDSNPYHTTIKKRPRSRGGLFTMWKAWMEGVSQDFSAHTERLRALYAKVWCALSGVGMEESAASAAALPVPTERVLSSLWWSWRRVSICLDIRRCLLGSEEPWVARKQGVDAGQDRQQRSLRAWKSAMGNMANAVAESRVCLAGEVPLEVSACSLLRHSIKQPEKAGTKPEANCGKVEVEVWDIRNVGPRNRYCANGVIVANCVIDHGGGIAKHGFFEDSIPWTLDWSERPSKEHVARPKIECPKCAAVYRGGKCRNCGYEPSSGERRSQGLEFDGAELQEVKRKDRKQSSVKQTNEQIMVSALFKMRNKTWRQALRIAYLTAEAQGTRFKVPKKFEVGGRVYKPLPYGDVMNAGRKVKDLYDFVDRSQV